MDQAIRQRAHALSRRTFIGGALSLPAAAWLAGCAHEDDDPTATHGYVGEEIATARPPAGLDDWSEVRDLFDLDPDVRHLSAYILAPHSRPVRTTVERHRRGLDRSPQEYFHATQWRTELDVAEHAAAYLGTDSDLIALTDSTTMGLGVVFGGLRLEVDDEILMTAHEHFVANEAARHAADRTGAQVRKIELYPPDAPEQATTTGILAAVERAIGRRTRVVLVTWVHSASGIKLPVREIADIVGRANRTRTEHERVLLFVDAAHGFGTDAMAVEELGCDALVAGCHKWLMGPRGTGIAWARPETWERMTPIIPTFDARLFAPWTDGQKGTAPPGPSFTPGGYHSFEHRWALKEAFDVHARIGAARIGERIAQLAGHLRDGLAETPRVRVHAAAEERLRSGVVCFTVDGQTPEETVDRLFDEHLVSATVTPYRVPFARLGTCWINTDEEVESAIRSVRAVA